MIKVKIIKIKAKTIILTIPILFISTAPVYASGLTDLMGETFGAGGQGAAISTIIALAIGSWILEQVASIIGKTNFSNWIKLTAMFLALLTFVTTGLTVLNKIMSFVLP